MAGIRTHERQSGVVTTGPASHHQLLTYFVIYLLSQLSGGPINQCSEIIRDSNDLSNVPVDLEFLAVRESIDTKHMTYS